MIIDNIKTEDHVRKLLEKILGNEFETGQLTTFKELGFTKFDIEKINDDFKNKYKLKSVLNNKPDGWYFPSDLKETAIIAEVKSPKNNILNNDSVINQIKKYMLIAATKYKKIIGIVSNGLENKIFQYLKGEIKELFANNEHELQSLEYYKKLYGSKDVDKELIYDRTYTINNIFYKKIKIKSLIQRMIFTAAMLIAKKMGAEFSIVEKISTWKEQTASHLKDRIEIDKKLNNHHYSKINQLYDFFKTIEPVIDKTNEDDLLNDKRKLLKCLDDISEQMDSPNWKGEDVMSIFFNEFSRYKGEIRNGQVFTPDHITSFMYKLAKINKNSNVLDACCGSGSFLVKSMAYMIDEAGGDITREAINIKTNQLFGIESDPEIFSLACANFLLHKDGKTNLLLADATTVEASNWIKSKKINKVLMNPPYEDQFHCLEIVKNVLDSVEKNADCLFLLPNNKLSKHNKNENGLTKRILKYHRLLKIIKLPKIFQGLAGSGDVAIFYFRAHEPHRSSKILTYWIKEDGFGTVKNKGRQDLLNIWNSNDCLEDKWLDIIENQLDDEENTKKWVDPRNDEIEYISNSDFEVTRDDFLKMVIDRYMFENPNIAKYFNLKGKK